MNVFNPEHDLCMANGDANFVPPASALEFGRDCAGLVDWIVEPSDGKVTAWGWDSVLKKRLLKEGVPESMLPPDDAVEEIRMLSRREMAVKASVHVNDFLSGRVSPELLGKLRPLSSVRAVSDERDIVPTVDCFGDAVMKAPLSGSGKGLRWARSGGLSASDLGWSRKVIARQGGLMVEKRLGIVRDFAMLFHIGQEKSDTPVSFEGYSLFFNDNGIYHGNVLASDSLIISELSNHVPESLLDNVKEALASFFRQEFLGRYEGFAGVDMCIYRDAGGFMLAPCLEINVRMTMGLLARRIYDRHFSLPDGRFRMCVEYSPHPGDLYSHRSSFFAALTEINASSRYAVVIE